MQLKFNHLCVPISNKKRIEKLSSQSLYYTSKCAKRVQVFVHPVRYRAFVYTKNNNLSVVIIALWLRYSIGML